MTKIKLKLIKLLFLNLLLIIFNNSCLYDDLVRLNKTQTLQPVMLKDQVDSNGLSKMILNGIIIDYLPNKGNSDRYPNIYGFNIRGLVDGDYIRVIESGSFPSKRGTFYSDTISVYNGYSYSIRACFTRVYYEHFGSEITFETPPGKAFVEIDEIYWPVNSITIESKIHTGGSPIIEQGICWSTTSNPSISNFHTHDSPGAQSTSGILIRQSTSGILIKGTTYFFKAYAINSYGISYSAEVVINYN